MLNKRKIIFKKPTIFTNSYEKHSTKEKEWMGVSGSSGILYRHVLSWVAAESVPVQKLLGANAREEWSCHSSTISPQSTSSV